MIVALTHTPTYYTALLEKPAAQRIMELMAPKHGSDIEQVLVTSLDISSDIEAINELDTALTLISAELPEAEKNTIFNPMFLPISAEELSTKLELDSTGDLVAIDGFQSPFIAAHIKVNMPEHPGVAEGKITYRQFQLPSIRDMLEGQAKVS